MRRPFDRRSRSGARSRAGVVYLLVAIALFAILPLLALVVHTGLVSLTRRQMQTAVDTAALEALRYRDSGDPAVGFRRAQLVVDNQFDDDFNRDNGDPLDLGAGPLVRFEPGSGTPFSGSNFRASARIVSPDATRPPVWKPRLELNDGDTNTAANDIAGDMVAGNYQNGISDHSEAPLSAATPYERADFLVATPEERVAGDYDSVLVRLRRSAESPVEDVVSVGPPVPFLFGRGPYGDATLLDRRERGTVVRATAIATARPAVVAGPLLGPAAPNVPQGLANFWVEIASWRSVTDMQNLPVNVTVNLDGDGTFSGGLDGGFVTDLDVSRPCVLGDSLSDRGADAPEAANDRFVPIYSVVSGTPRVVAFGLVNVTDSSSTTMDLRIRTDTLASANASAGFVRRVAAPAADLAVVMAEFRTFADSPYVLRAATSVRSVD